MTHPEFVEAWQAGRVTIAVDPAAAAAFVSARLLLPFAAVAVIGLGIALVFWGWTLTGIAVGTAGILVPRLIKRGARNFLLSQVGTDAELFEAGVRAGVIRILPIEPGRSEPDPAEEARR